MRKCQLHSACHVHTSFAAAASHGDAIRSGCFRHRSPGAGEKLASGRCAALASRCQPRSAVAQGQLCTPDDCAANTSSRYAENARHATRRGRRVLLVRPLGARARTYLSTGSRRCRRPISLRPVAHFDISQPSSDAKTIPAVRVYLRWRASRDRQPRHEWSVLGVYCEPAENCF